MKTELNRGNVSAAGYRFAVVVSRWNDPITSRLAAGARGALIENGADEADIEIFEVPGAFELPIACLKAAETGRFNAIIALGAVIRGDTSHFDYVAGEASRGIMQVSLDIGVPVLFGVITADNMEQAEARSGDGVDNKGYEAALSSIEMAHVIREIGQEKSSATRGGN